MCYSYSAKVQREEMIERFKEMEAQLGLFQPVFHVSGFAHPMMPVITNEGKLEFQQWGLIPSWVKDMKQASEIAKQTLNARSETIFEKPAFRASATAKRCLIPATGFFESRWIDSAGKNKIPYLISVEESLAPKGIFCFGGLSNTWVDRQTGEEIKSYSIITTEANSIMAEIHNSKKRMPLIITDERFEWWLDPATDKESLQRHMQYELFPSEQMKTVTVSKLANNARLDRNVPEVMEPFSYEQTLF